MTLRVGFAIVGERQRHLLPREVDARPVRIGRRGDLDVDISADVLVFRRSGRLLVASASSRAPVTLAGEPLPTWFVPLSLPCTLTAGDRDVRLFDAVVRAPPIPPAASVHDTFTHTTPAFQASDWEGETAPRALRTIPPLELETTVAMRHALGPLAGARGALDASTFGGLPPPPPAPEPRFHVIVRRRSRWPDVAFSANVLREGAIAFAAEWRAASRETKLALGAMLVASVALVLLAR